MLRDTLKGLIPKKLRKQISMLRSSTYSNDGFLTTHNSDFLKDRRFVESYKLGKATGSWGDSDIEWRAYIACWAAEKGKRLRGDFVECGVNRGGLSRTVMNYVGFQDMQDRKFYLLDTYSGIPDDFSHLAAQCNLKDYSECYTDVLREFSEFRNVVVVKGAVPGTLSQVDSEHVCYLSLDMNCAEPEIAAAEFFWEKLVSGAVIVLDDYGFIEAYRRQKQAFDEFAKSKKVEVLSLPTGQGLIFKP